MPGLALADLLRCVLGNPFQPQAWYCPECGGERPAHGPLACADCRGRQPRARVHPAWRTPVVLALAGAAHEERLLPSGHLDPDRLAVLADALEEAGCSGSALLGHLRGPGPHVRGCHVVDLLLGKQ
jgi:hypothetical protein